MDAVDKMSTKFESLLHDPEGTFVGIGSIIHLPPRLRIRWAIFGSRIDGTVTRLPQKRINANLAVAVATLYFHLTDLRNCQQSDCKLVLQLPIIPFELPRA